MKKAYINPEVSTVLLTLQNMVAVSNPVGFDETLEDETITVDDMLSRRQKDVWADEEEEEELY